MERIEIRQHPGGVVADDNGLDSIRLEHGLGQTRVEIPRERADDEKAIRVPGSHFTATNVLRMRSP